MGGCVCLYSKYEMEIPCFVLNLQDAQMFYGHHKCARLLYEINPE